MSCLELSAKCNDLFFLRSLAVPLLARGECEIVCFGSSHQSFWRDVLDSGVVVSTNRFNGVPKALMRDREVSIEETLQEVTILATKRLESSDLLFYIAVETHNVLFAFVDNV